MEPLILDDISESIWRDFHADARGALARISPTSSAQHTLARWSRARELGAPVDGGVDDELIERGGALRQRTERLEGLFSDGAALLESATSSAAERDFLLLVADADGVVVRTSGGGGFADEARRVRLIEGACWSEGARGTNAIGTAILEQRPAVVRGHAHFGRRFHGLVCSAATVRGVDGRIVAVVDATSRLGTSDVDIGFLVRTTARALEEVLRLRAYASVGAAVATTLARSLDRMACPAILVESTGRIARANEAARGAVAAAPGQPVKAAFGIGWSELCDEARGGSGCAVEIARRPWLLRADPIVGGDGAVLAVMVLLEPATRGAARGAGFPRSPGANEPPFSARSGSAPSASPRTAHPVAGDAADAFAALFAEDPTLCETIERARRFAPTAVPVVLLGETGSGKELMAHAIHRASSRAAEPFLAVNCGAVAPQLLESELFGAAPHAFTGADPRGRRGLIEAAHGGTLFLDEVAEMPTQMQASLLRVLESGELRRVGEAQSRSVDIRLVCATCRDLPALVAEGRFRSDLYYRLKGVVLTLPALRARADLVGLARHLLLRLDGRVTLDDAAAQVLARHPWPGNVRELRSVLEVALALAEDGVIRAHDLPLDVSSLPGQLLPTPVEPAPVELTEVEGSVVRRVLAEVAGNVSVAARRLGVARSTLYRMMRRHGLG